MAHLPSGKFHTFPLSLSQQNIWSLEQTCPGTPINNISTTLHIHGRVDLPSLQQSLDLVLASDPSLRTRIVLEDGVPAQYHAPFESVPFPVYDFTLSSASGIESWESAVTRETIPLLGGPLYRFILLRTGEADGALVMKLHHIISDGWSQILLCNRIGQTYLDLLRGQTPELAESPSYEAHVQEEQAYLASRAYGRDEAYWASVLEKAGEPSVLKNVRSAVLSPVGQRKSFLLPQSLDNDIYTFCTKNRVSPFSALYLALAIYFKRIGGADRFTIGVPIYNRADFSAKNTSGMFVSTLPFFNELHADWSFTQCSDHLNEQWLEMLRHQRLPFSHIQRLAQKQDGGSGRLFQIALSYQNGQMLSSSDASVDFSGRWHYSGYQMEQLCIHLSDLHNGRRYAIDYDYLTQLFSEAEIEDLHTSLVNILQESLHDADKPICKLSLLTPQERERVLYTFNHTDKTLYDEDVYSRFAAVVARHGTRAALICRGERVTYRQVDEMAARIHAALRAVSDVPAVAAVLLPREPALPEAMMGILRAGWAFVILPPDLPVMRMQEILRQSGAAALITTRAMLGVHAPDVSKLSVIDLAALGGEIVAAQEVSPDAPAYIVYTSGSTGKPKGVEIPRRSLANLSDAMSSVYGSGAVLSLCSVGFDAFLLESVVALLNAQTVLLPEDAELESPQKLAELISGYGVGFFAITPSRLSALLKCPAFSAAMGRMESLVCGGEAFSGSLLQQLRQVTGARIYNQYGPSETTVAVSMKLLNRASVITVGAPMQNCRLYVLDPWMNPLPVGVYGDLYVGGMCVGLGYRGQPELTEKSYLNSPFVLGERIYRTGDLACWTPEGEILLGGRADRQVKLRGLRVEPQEVSACLCTHPLVKQSATRLLTQKGQSLLVSYFTSDEPVSEAELLSLCASYLPRYMVPAAILRVAEIPLSRNGKVDEARLPVPEIGGGESDSLPRSDTERTLLEIFSSVLERRDLGAQSDYFLCGGNSLNAMQTIGLIAERTGRTLRVADLYACRSARRLAALLAGDSPAAPVRRILKAPAPERYPLSPTQQGLYVQSCMDPTGRAYQMPGAFRLQSAPDRARLERAFCALIAEQPLLHTAFVSENDGIFARVQEHVSFTLPVISGGDFDDVTASLLLPFALDQAPLLRAALWEKDGVWTLFVNTHHLIGDGMSTPVLMHRLDALYQGGAVQTPEVSYLDYAWQLSAEEKEPGQAEYWARHLRPLPEMLELPADGFRTHTFDYRGGDLTYTISDDLSRRCDAFCAENGISSYMLYLSAYGILLSRLSGRETLLVGAPVSGRLLPQTQEMCGPFINTLPLRLSPTDTLTVADYLRAVREEVNAMLDHQQTGLEEITSALNLPRSLSQSPLYQVMFTQRPLDADSFTLGGEPMSYRPVSTGSAKMELVVELAREAGRDTLCVQYAASLFHEESVRYWCRCMEQILASLIAGKEQTLQDVRALSGRDQYALLDARRHAVTPFVDLPIHTMIAQQALIEPDAAALIFHDTVCSRQELERMAGRIANVLWSAGVRPCGHVGIAVGRGSGLVAAMLAILKCGCAYVPLLASFPEQRLCYMLQTAQITHVLCDEKTRALLPENLPCTLLDVNAEASAEFTPVPVGDDDLCNILFTSGSTGKPKGVMLRHRSVANMFMNMHRQLDRAEGPILCTTNLVFDTFVAETLLSLAAGKQIVLCDEEEMMLPWKLAELITRYHVEIVQFTPARFQMCLSNEAFLQAIRGLKLILFGGEVLTHLLLEQTCRATDAITVNMYGPTEATVYMTMVDVRPGGPVSIGKPLENGRIYVLDEQQRPVLPTAYGELWLAGEVLSAGYISRPDLTEKAFAPDPFFPGEKMYRTGDIARMRLDGSYDFLCRRDSQVKLNGQRVELSEITGAVMTSGSAVLAATVPVRHPDGSMQLCCFYQPSADAAGGEREILQHMRTVLPVYMMPSRLVALEKMPHTASGKIDLKTLGEMAAAYDSGAAEVPAPTPAPAAGESPDAPIDDLKPAPMPVEAPAEIPAAAPVSAPQDLEALLLQIWSQVLGRRNLSGDQSFFEQGGTSLAALSILSQYHNHHLVLSLQEFYENPAAAQQARLLTRCAQPSAAAPQAPAASQAPAAPQKELPRAVPTAAAVYPRTVPPLPKGRASSRSLGAVLLTGATGFLGAHLLRALLDAGASRVYCLIRGDDPDRLWNALSWYFGSGWIKDCASSVEVLCGDITRAGLGLSPADYQRLSGSIRSVWHCAADVRHYAADEEAFLAANLTGTENIIKLARAARAALYHMSTESVSGQRLAHSDESAVFTEHDFDIGQDWRANLYSKSKFLAENAVLDAVSAGLTGRIFRLGRLVGRGSDGTFQKNPESNAFYLTLRAVAALGAIPASMAELPVDLTPVDWCAAAIVSLRQTPLTVLHMQSPTPFPLARVVRAVIPEVEILPDGEFDARMERALSDGNGEVLGPLLDLWQRNKTCPSTIAVESALTAEQLRQIGFPCDVPGPERTLRAFRFDR